ncbi:hypothetical protein, partial [Escherichia coli]|uniref:hypothetical protein n=1 Tax=Escherichia coli TaxID=562 RepID=UPI001BC8A043
QALPENSELSCFLPPVLLLHFHTHVPPLQQDVGHPIPAGDDCPMPLKRHIPHFQIQGFRVCAYIYMLDFIQAVKDMDSCYVQVVH